MPDTRITPALPCIEVTPIVSLADAEVSIRVMGLLPEQIVTLCCGLAGRAYALLNFYRHTNETLWLDRARDLALRAARVGNIPEEYRHSLYKGEFGLAVLAADLEEPNEATMPFFEPMGYRNVGE